MKQNEIEHKNFIEWCNKKNIELNMTQSEANFTKQLFDILDDYPSFKEKITEVGVKHNLFKIIEQHLKDIK